MSESEKLNQELLPLIEDIYDENKEYLGDRQIIIKLKIYCLFDEKLFTINVISFFII